MLGFTARHTKQMTPGTTSIITKQRNIKLGPGKAQQSYNLLLLG